MEQKVIKRKGDIGLTQAIAKFTALGYNVSLPIADFLPYDLIVEENNKLFKVQVKYSSTKTVNLQRSGANSSTYKKGDYDWLYIFSENKHYLIKNCICQYTLLIPEKYII